jgi:hypothetical protein
VIRPLKKWRSDLIGSPFFVFTDHKTLENFDNQRDLSRRQARWMEFLSQYDSQFVYVRGDRNSVADALSRRPTDFCSADAELTASRPYPVSLADEDDILAHIFDPVDRNVLCAISALTDAAPDVRIPSLTLSIAADKDFLRMLREGYDSDPWTKSLISAAHGINNLKLIDGLWFLDDRLLIPNAACRKSSRDPFPPGTQQSQPFRIR